MNQAEMVEKIMEICVDEARKNDLRG